jgi:hypothetical protein
MAYDPAHSVVLLFGGRGARSDDETWTWDGSRWRLLAPAHHPSARSGAALAFDSQQGTVVLFGGQDASGRWLSDTWKWDGMDWILLAPPTSPPPRLGAGMVYDPSIGRLVLFGGLGGVNNLLHDTWTWGGGDWSPAPEAGEPTLDMPGSVLAYDARGGRVLLAGVRGQAQTWAFLAGKWSQLGAGLLAPCVASSGVYDSAVAAPVIVGTIAANPVAVCAWSGTDWQPRSAEGPPPGRFGMQVAYDDRSSELVMFGGLQDPGVFLDDTWTWTPGRGWSKAY